MVGVLKNLVFLLKKKDVIHMERVTFLCILGTLLIFSVNVIYMYISKKAKDC